VNIEDSKGTLINAISDLPFSNGEVLLVSPPLSKKLHESCPEFSQITKIIFWADGRYVILHCETVDEGRFTSHRSVHSAINHIPDAVVLAWANE
jgi:hypothetical protein